MVIKGDGSIGMGTKTPEAGYKLHVSGNIKQTSGSLTTSGDATAAAGDFAHCGCKQCNNGTYSPSPGATDPTQCVVCPIVGTRLDLPAGYRACWCQDGYARTDRFGPCVRCDESGGTECRNDVRQLRAGYWWLSWVALQEYTSFAADLQKEHDYDPAKTVYTGPIAVSYPCPRPDSCLGGLGAQCAVGYTGLLCSQCDAGYYVSGDECTVDAYDLFDGAADAATWTTDEDDAEIAEDLPSAAALLDAALPLPWKYELPYHYEPLRLVSYDKSL